MITVCIAVYLVIDSIYWYIKIRKLENVILRLEQKIK